MRGDKEIVEKLKKVSKIRGNNEIYEKLRKAEGEETRKQLKS